LAACRSKLPTLANGPLDSPCARCTNLYGKAAAESAHHDLTLTGTAVVKDGRANCHRSFNSMEKHWEIEEWLSKCIFGTPTEQFSELDERKQFEALTS
jgi:hypothetical protein